MMAGKKDKRLLLEAGSVIGIMITLMLIFYMNLFHYNYKMNSDVASEALLGEVIWESKEIMPEEWYPSSEARIISTPNIAALFYGITGNLTLAMGLACCMMTLLILLSILFFCTSVGMDRYKCLLTVFLSLALPSCFDLCELVYLFACYYAALTAILFFTLGVYGDSVKNGKMRAVPALSGLVFALLMGFQGVRGILVLYMPLLCVEVVRIIWGLCRRQDWRKADKAVSVWVFLMLMISFWGSSFPFSIGKSFSRNIRKGFSKLFCVVIPDMGRALGFGSGNILSQLGMGLMLLFAIYVGAGTVKRLFKARTQEIEPTDWVYLVICASPFLTALIVAFTTVESTRRYYFMLLYAVVLSMAPSWTKKGIRSLAISLAAILAVFHIWTLYIPVIGTSEPPVSDAYMVSEFLYQNNISTAYATFEHANTMTVLSNGKVRVAPVASIARMDICKWLSSRKWYPPDLPTESTTAYIVTETEKEEFAKFLTGKEEEVREAGQIGKYIIYVSDYNYAYLSE